jgi:excisionase family DNA binding protein
VSDLYKKQIVRWIDANGKRCAPATPGATKRVEESRKWYGTVRGKPEALSRDKATAEKMLRRLLTKADEESVGLGDPYADHKTQPLAEHLKDFKTELEANGSTPFHVRQVLDRIGIVFNGIGATMPADLSVDRVQQWLVAFRADKEAPALLAGKKEWTPDEAAALLGISRQAVRAAIARHGLPAIGNGKARRYPRATVEALLERAGRGASAQTVNHYVAALRSFGRWLVRPGAGQRLSKNPLAGLKLVCVETDRRHDRRELTADELRRLLAATRASARTFRGLSGEDRFHLYATACGTGFRAGGLASLIPASFNLTSDGPTATLSARRNKSKKTKKQPLPADVADLLRAYLKDKPAGQPIWGGTWATDKKAAAMLRGDLEAAGIPYVVEGPDGPLYADFHALRHTYLTLGGRAGINLRTLQELAGHSTATLTERYTHVRLHDLAVAGQEGG